MIQLYAIDVQRLPDPKEEPGMLRYLHGERKIQTMKYLQTDDRKRSLGAGILLGEVLPRHGASPEEITRSPQGKPQAGGTGRSAAISKKLPQNRLKWGNIFFIREKSPSSIGAKKRCAANFFSASGPSRRVI